MKRIAIYGKGGIGKSTTVANISTALAQEGVRVMQIGCDPKADSTIALTNGVQISTVLDMLRANGENTTLSDITHEGSCGVICVESGGPKPGSGCAGRGIISALEKLEELSAYEIYQPDIVLYDVLGDVVCGGFAMPIRKGYADLVYVVTSGERMSLFAAGNIIEAVRSFGARGYAGLGGIIVNKKGFDNEFELVKNIAAELNVEIVFEIERDGIVQDAESLNKTVVEAYPNSAQAKRYQKLARELYTRVPQEQAACQS